MQCTHIVFARDTSTSGTSIMSERSDFPAICGALLFVKNLLREEFHLSNDEVLATMCHLLSIRRRLDAVVQDRSITGEQCAQFLTKIHLVHALADAEKKKKD